MTLRVESHGSAEEANHLEIKRKVEAAIKRALLVSCNAEVNNYGSMPRSERKSKRVFDNRPS
jgi:phenylacetate-CoA ligase